MPHGQHRHYRQPLRFTTPADRPRDATTFSEPTRRLVRRKRLPRHEPSVIRFGLIAGVSRLADAVAMRVMDGLMSLPAILIGMARMALNRASLRNVALPITVGEMRRVTRLVRGVVLTLCEQPFVEAAIAGGVGQLRIL